ncbi:ABC transporter ATP-binding protein [Shinella sp.]|uniref:ABC transporter ATP-binding protein n=1 Tax=Shinella sp. TaxID=1870904 RepID=UPI003F6F1772
MTTGTTAAGEAIVEAHSLEAAYGANTVLHDVSLLVPERRLTVLAGPNGSGKSTLLSLLSRVLKPTRGTVLLDGKAMAALPTREVAKKLGLLPQAPLVPESISVYDLVSRGRYPHQGFLKQWSDADEAAVDRALAATTLTALAGRAVDSLSGGQRQRAFIAMTLAQETPVILLDEPTTFLDLRYQNEVMDLIGSLTHDHGRTVVTVLHDLNAALQYADRIVFLKAGRIHTVVEDLDTCTESLIRDVFETAVTRLTHPVTGKPAFLAVPSGKAGAS